MRCDSKKDWRRVSFPCFNPHTYMRCDGIFRHLSEDQIGFNPHTYMRCDSSVTGIFRHLSVSIHTPTWGVTFVDENNVVYGMFQSTHLHEVWLGGYQQKWTMYMFQSTHLHEVWPSIPILSNSGIGFNPHTYMRCDVPVLKLVKNTMRFQSTHLHEVWLIVWFLRKNY